jgi:hypothetical protein
LIEDLNWWLTNGLQIWETIIQKTKTVFFEIEREIKSDIFVTPFTEFVRFFKIHFAKSITIRTEYKLWFLSKLVPLQDTFLNIPDEIEIKFPCSTRHLELVIKTNLDFDRYIDTKLR